MIVNRPIDPAMIKHELASCDQEYLREHESGSHSKLPTIIDSPSTDPFGLEYAWLATPLSPFDGAFEKFEGMPVTERLSKAGPELIAVITKEAATGVSEAEVQSWVHEEFASYCRSLGMNGEDLLEMIDQHGVINDIMVRDVLTVLEGHPMITGLSFEQRVALAMICIDVLAPK